MLRCVMVRVMGARSQWRVCGDSALASSHGSGVLVHLTVHHVAFDGASTSVFLGELQLIYERMRVASLSSASDGMTASLVDEVASRSSSLLATKGLPSLPFEYVDYALWQRSEALAPHLASQRAYWRVALREGDLPVLELPLDYPRPALQTFNGDVVPFSMGASLSSRLASAGRSHGCTLFQSVLCVWSLVLCLHASQEEVVIGSPYHGRDMGGTDVLVGYFVNMLALRIETGGGRYASSSSSYHHHGACSLARDVASGGMRCALVPISVGGARAVPRRSHDASRNAVYQAMIGGALRCAVASEMLLVRCVSKLVSRRHSCGEREGSHALSVAKVEATAYVTRPSGEYQHYFLWSHCACALMLMHRGLSVRAQHCVVEHIFVTSRFSDVDQGISVVGLAPRRLFGSTPSFRSTKETSIVILIKSSTRSRRLCNAERVRTFGLGTTCEVTGSASQNSTDPSATVLLSGLSGDHRTLRMASGTNVLRQRIAWCALRDHRRSLDAVSRGALDHSTYPAIHSWTTMWWRPCVVPLKRIFHVGAPCQF